MTSKGSANLQNANKLCTVDLESSLREDLQRVDQYGIEGSNPIIENEVIPQDFHFTALHHVNCLDEKTSKDHKTNNNTIPSVGPQDRQEVVAVPQCCF